eukprot:scaffold415642_cov38-Prasinocladus_malaysianus.AAC.1
MACLLPNLSQDRMGTITDLQLQYSAAKVEQNGMLCPEILRRKAIIELCARLKPTLRYDQH